MSKGTKIADAERTAIMLDLLRRRYEGDGSEPAARLAHVVIEEVAPGTGFSSPNRYADVLVLGVWPSKGLSLDGFEIKASRADLKRELADPAKHRAVARYCDTWTLLAWDESTLIDGVPDEWGITLTRDGEHGRELVTHRKAPVRSPDPWPRSFVCSLVRNAAEQAPGAAYVARAVVAAHERAERDSKRQREEDLRELVWPIARLVYGDNEWRWPKEARDPRAVLKLAAERLQQPTLALTVDQPERA